MFEPLNTIIAVDNNPSHLATIGNAFLKSGLGCRLLEYDQEFSKPLENIRVAFFDINLTDKLVDLSIDAPEDLLKNNSAIFNDLAVAIGTYISKKNGPFALIFWTQNKQLVDYFIKYIQDPDRGYSDLPAPSLIGCIDKDAFLEDAKQEDLKDKILSFINDDVIRLLFDFENKAFKAASMTINKVFEIIPKADKWGESTHFKVNFEKVFSKIAAESLGVEHAQKNPDKAIYEGLIPIQNHYLIANSSDIWKNTLVSLKSGSIAFPENFNQSRLNTYFHIEFDYPKGDKNIRGLVFEIETCAIDFKKYFGISFETWQQKTIPIKAAKRDAIVAKSNLVAIEISSVCDYSQNKLRINKYILALKTPPIRKGSDYDKLPTNTMDLLENILFYDGLNEFQVWVNLNFVFSLYEDDNILKHPVFMFKKEIMDMIGNRYANHVSRIGITSFSI